MARDVEKYCWECAPCQRAKLPGPIRAPITNRSALADDSSGYPLSPNNNRLLLVVQDCFTKWADAIPLPDQTAARITAELVKLCSVMGIPGILHSDQGHNFESTLLHSTLEVLVCTLITSMDPD